MNQLTRMRLRAIKFQLRERLIDAAYMAWPVFAVTGVAVGAVKFWQAFWGMFL